MSRPQAINVEVKLMKELQHPNIIGFGESFVDKQNFYTIVMGE